MLKIPGPGDTPPALVRKSLKVVPVSLPDSLQRSRELAESAAVAGEQPARIREKKRRRPQAKAEDEPNWDKVPEHRVRKGGSGAKSRLIGIGISVVMLLVLLAVLAVIVQRKRAEDQPVQQVIAPVVQPPVSPDSQPEPMNLPLEMNRSEVELIAELEPLTKKFLEATTVEELLPLVRDREAVEPKLRKFYPDGKVPAPGMSAFNTTGSIAFRDKLASVSIRTRDFEAQQIAYLRTAEGLKIDWESYVGWSEMTWEEFLAKKPTNSVLFRVSMKAVEYYNFSFSDDRRWSSYQFRSPNAEFVMYGYAKRDSEVDRKLKPNDVKATTLVTVRLKFQPGETSANQVLIDEVVADGWVEGIDEK
jgi:hypothetical protein